MIVELKSVGSGINEASMIFPQNADGSFDTSDAVDIHDVSTEWLARLNCEDAIKVIVVLVQNRNMDKGKTLPISEWVKLIDSYKLARAADEEAAEAAMSAALDKLNSRAEFEAKPSLLNDAMKGGEESE